MDTQVSAGDSLHIPCVPPDGFPQPEVTWFFSQGGAMVPLKMASERVKYRDGYLTISSAMEQDAGRYECRASNKMGTEVSRQGTVKINGKFQSHFYPKSFAD